MARGRPHLRGMARLPRPFLIILILCCAVEAAQILWSASLPRIRFWADGYGGFWSPLMWGGRGLYPGQGFVMFATYGFLHSGLLHLGMNMLSMVALVRQALPMLPAGRLLLIYAVSQVAGAALFGLMAPQSPVPMIGASGAIFGLAGALFGAVAVRLRARGLPLRRLATSAAVMVGLNLALTVALPGIAWQAHLGGAIAGLVLGVALAPAARVRLG